MLNETQLQTLNLRRRVTKINGAKISMGIGFQLLKLKSNRNLSNDNEVEVLEIMVGDRILGNPNLLQILSTF